MIAANQRMLSLILLASGLGLAVLFWSHRTQARAQLPPAQAGAPQTGELSLLEKLEIIQQRYKSKNKVIAQLLAGELTLVEAAEWFRYINDNPVEFPDCRRYPADRAGTQKACREVIAWVEVRLRGQVADSEASAAIRRLQGELDALP